MAVAGLDHDTRQGQTDALTQSGPGSIDACLHGRTLVLSFDDAQLEPGDNDVDIEFELGQDLSG